MRDLVLSLFPGIGMLDRGFEEEGFCVVRGPDLLWGGNIREFHPPGVFQGVIGGDPCQSHSSLANLVRAKGLEPRFPDLTPEFVRIIEEAEPEWFLRENVPAAPDIEPAHYGVTSFLLDNRWLGEAQMRKRRFWFGVWGGEAPNLRRWIPGVALELPEPRQAVAADSRAVPVKLGGSGKVKVTAVHGSHGQGQSERNRRDFPRRTLAEMLEFQGFPSDWLDHQPWTMQTKRQMVGNGVPLPMSRALARAVVKALEKEEKK